MPESRAPNLDQFSEGKCGHKPVNRLSGIVILIARNHPAAAAGEANSCLKASTKAPLSLVNSTRMMTAPDPSLTQVKRNGSQCS